MGFVQVTVLSLAKCFTCDVEQTKAYSFASDVIEGKDAIHILTQALPFRKGSARETEQQRALIIKARFDGSHIRACAKRMRVVAKEANKDIQFPATLSGANALNAFD